MSECTTKAEKSAMFRLPNSDLFFGLFVWISFQILEPWWHHAHFFRTLKYRADSKCMYDRKKKITKVSRRGHSGQVEEHGSNDENVPPALLQAGTSHTASDAPVSLICPAGWMNDVRRGIGDWLSHVWLIAWMSNSCRNWIIDSPSNCFVHLLIFSFFFLCNHRRFQGC